MPAYNANTISLDAIEGYFAHLNPIAHRIACDVRNTKSTYGQLWYTLNSNEQNDIINETLIKPEISLRYFDSFASSCSSDRSSPSSCKSGDGGKSPSADSMTAVVLSVATPRGDQTKRISKLKPLPTSSTKNYYAYNGRNLRTFALQKVALKIIQDDTLGTYRDEHSLPFSYRTKSQINLQLLNNVDQTANEAGGEAYSFGQAKSSQYDEAYRLGQAKSSHYAALQNSTELKKNIANFKKLRSEIKINEKKAEAPAYEETYEKIENSHETKRLREKNSHNPEMVASRTNKNGNVLKALIQATSISTPIAYKAYRDPYYESEETANLMHNCGMMTASSSSATTSDDDDRNADEDDDDEKTLCEEVKLLSNDISMRGFDFLNNW